MCGKVCIVVGDVMNLVRKLVLGSTPATHPLIHSLTQASLLRVYLTLGNRLSLGVSPSLPSWSFHLRAGHSFGKG